MDMNAGAYEGEPELEMPGVALTQREPEGRMPFPEKPSLLKRALSPISNYMAHGHRSDPEYEGLYDEAVIASDKAFIKLGKACLYGILVVLFYRAYKNGVFEAATAKF